MIKRIALVLALALVGTLGFAIPAQAAWSCPAERVCFYWGANGVGSPSLGTRYDFQVTLGGNDYLDIYVGEPVRSNASSLKNTKANTYVSRLYGTSDCFSLYGYQQPNLHNGGTWNIQGSVNNNVQCFRIDWV